MKELVRSSNTQTFNKPHASDFINHVVETIRYQDEKEW